MSCICFKEHGVGELRVDPDCSIHGDGAMRPAKPAAPARPAPPTGPRFYALVDAVHDALIQETGCKHPRFQPTACSLVARRLWDAGVTKGAISEG
jgi:hypothetical protein